MKTARRKTDPAAVKARIILVNIWQFQAHCNEFLRSRGLPVYDQNLKTKGHK